MTRMLRKAIVAAAVTVLIAAPAAAVERGHIGRYSTPEMADPIVWVPPVRISPMVVQPVTPEPVVTPAPAVVTPAAPAASVPEPAPVAAEPAALPEPGTLVIDDPEAGPYIYDPEQPNEGRPNGAGGWDEDPAPVEP